MEEPALEDGCTVVSSMIMAMYSLFFGKIEGMKAFSCVRRMTPSSLKTGGNSVLVTKLPLVVLLCMHAVELSAPLALAHATWALAIASLSSKLSSWDMIEDGDVCDLGSKAIASASTMSESSSEKNWFFLRDLFDLQAIWTDYDTSYI